MPALPDSLRLYFTIQLHDSTDVLYIKIGVAVKGGEGGFCGDFVGETAPRLSVCLTAK